MTLAKANQLLDYKLFIKNIKMMRVAKTLFTTMTRPMLPFGPQLTIKPIYKFSLFTDKMQKKQAQKSAEQIRKEIQHMANKPSFTLMDYKQRILDELNKLKTSIRAKMSSQTQEQQKQLEIQKKVLSALYEDELNGLVRLRMQQKKAISLISQVEYEKVCQIFTKAERYKKMHIMLRDIKQKGEPLPTTMSEVQYLYQRSGLEFQGRKSRYLRYQKRSRIQRNRFIKWKINQ